MAYISTQQTASIIHLFYEHIIKNTKDTTICIKDTDSKSCHYIDSPFVSLTPNDINDPIRCHITTSGIHYHYHRQIATQHTLVVGYILLLE